MKLIIKVLQIIVLLGTFGLVFCWTLVGVFKSNQQLTAILDKSEFYQVASKIISEQINTQIAGDEQAVVAAKQAVEQNMSSQLAKTTLQPIQIAIIDWLAEDQQDLKLELDLQAIKTKLTSTVEPDQKFMLTKVLPDRLILVEGEELSAQDLNSLRRVKSVYQFSESAIPVLAGAVLASSALLLIINLPRGSKKFTAFLMPLAIASVVGLILVGISYSLEGMVVINSSLSQPELGANLSLRLFFAVTQQTRWAWIVIGILSISGIIISRTVFRTKDKKLKEKRKK